MEINKQTLSQQIYEKLRQEIVQQKIPPASRLVIKDLTDTFGVSSTPVRDALHRLEQEGLVESNSNQGAQVIALSIEDMQEVSELTTMFDSFALERSMRFSETTDKLADDLRKSLDGTQDVLSQMGGEDRLVWWSYDDHFHRQMYRYADNQRLTAASTKYRGIFSILTHQSVSITSIFNRFEEHVAIYNAVRERDAEKAKRLLVQHFETGFLDVRKSLESKATNQ